MDDVDRDINAYFLDPRHPRMTQNEFDVLFFGARPDPWAEPSGNFRTSEERAAFKRARAQERRDRIQRLREQLRDDPVYQRAQERLARLGPLKERVRAERLEKAARLREQGLAIHTGPHRGLEEDIAKAGRIRTRRTPGAFSPAMAEASRRAYWSLPKEEREADMRQVALALGEDPEEFVANARNPYEEPTNSAVPGTYVVDPPDW